MSYTTGQQVGLSLTYKLSSTIGIFCSSFLLSELIRDHAKGEGNPVKRALLGVCFFEICDAFGYFLSGWATPRDDGWVWAVGTQGSCSFQGFLLQTAIGAPLNNGLLMFFFYMLSRRQDRSAKAVAKSEWKFHTAIDGYALGSSLLLLFLGQYNNLGNGLCWIIGTPYGCGNSVLDGDPDLPCERGDNAFIYGLTMFYIPLWSSVLVIIYLNCAMRKYLLDENAEEDAQWVTTQALLYSIAFFITWTPSTLVSTMIWFRSPWYWLQILTAICEPLQGFWNLLIFMRNRPDTVENLRRLLSCKLQCCVVDDDTIDEVVTPNNDVPTTIENTTPDHKQSSLYNTNKLDETDEMSESDFKTNITQQ